MENIIRITDSALDIDKLYQWLSEKENDGAITTFTGKVRTLENNTESLYLEHYSGMTELVLMKIIEEARLRWSLTRIAVVHRVGHIGSNESIVFIGVSSSHRKDAFSAVEFIIDVLKAEAPFWKKEKTSEQDNWVEVKKSDKESLKKWY